MHLALENAETIHRLVEQGELLVTSFYSEYEKDAAGVETEFARGELTGWRNTLHTVYHDRAEDIVKRVVTRTRLTIPNGEVRSRAA
jgi:hypothetical protein